VMATAIGLAALLGSAFFATRTSVNGLIVLCAAAGLILLLRWPGLGLVAMAALSFTLPLQIGTGSQVSLTPPVLLIPAVGVAWLAEGLRAGTLRLPRSPTLLPLLLFVAGGLLSLLAGNTYWDPMVTRPQNLLFVQLAQCAIWALSAAIFVLAAELGRRGRWLERATFAFLAAATLPIAGWIVHGLPAAIGWNISVQASSSMFWVWLAAMATGQLLCNRRLTGVARLALLALLGAAAYVLWRLQYDWISGWLPFTVAAVAVVWLRVWRRSRVAAILLALVLVLLAVVLFPRLFQYVGGEQELEISWGGRQTLYRTVLDLVKPHPILGLGPAAYRHYAFTRWLSMGEGGALWLRPAVSSHNNFLDLYAQLGLVGVVFFLWFLVALAVVGWKQLSRFRGGFEEGYVTGAMGGLAGSLAAMMLVDWFLPFVYNVGFPGFRSSALAWMFLGGLVAFAQRSGATDGDAVTGEQGSGRADGAEATFG